MPDLETDDLPQKAVLWAATGRTDEHAEDIVEDPVEIDVRWETRKIDAKDPFGNTVKLDVVVYVDREVPIKSRMWLGELAEWYGTGSAGQDDEVMSVKFYSEIPDVKGAVSRRAIGLVRYKDSPE